VIAWAGGRRSAGARIDAAFTTSERIARIVRVAQTTSRRSSLFKDDDYRFYSVRSQKPVAAVDAFRSDRVVYTLAFNGPFGSRLRPISCDVRAPDE